MRDIFFQLISESEHLAVLFYSSDASDASSHLESIDDDLDASDVAFVKANSEEIAREFGQERLPAVAVFNVRNIFFNINGNRFSASR